MAKKRNVDKVEDDEFGEVKSEDAGKFGWKSSDIDWHTPRRQPQREEQK